MVFNLSKRANPQIGIKMSGFCDTAKLLRTGVAEIRTVDEVESAGSGFLSASKRPKILFEGHYFYRLLKPLGLAKKAQQLEPTICYPVWTKKHYIGREGEYSRIAKATELCHKFGISDAYALMSCSWGRFQIMGANFKLAGYTSVEQMVEDMFQDEIHHLTAFANYLKNTGLDDELRARKWTPLSRGYNGPGYLRNNYPVKLANAFAKFSRVKIDCSLYVKSANHVVVAMPGERFADPDVVGFENTSLDDRYASADEGSLESSTSFADDPGAESDDDALGIDLGGLDDAGNDTILDQHPDQHQDQEEPHGADPPQPNIGDAPPNSDPNLDPAQRSGKENVVIETVEKMTLWDYIKMKFAALTGGSFTYTTAVTKAQEMQTLGLPENFTFYALLAGAIFALILVLIWFISWWREERAKDKQTDQMVKENSTEGNFIHFASKEELEAWKKWGAVVVRR